MVMGACLICCLSNNCPAAQENHVPYQALFDEVCQKVETYFYDAEFINNTFPSLKTEYTGRIAEITTQTGFSKTVNDMLRQLNASHTYYLSPADWEYYHLAAVFSSLPDIQALFHNKEILYPSVGILTRSIDGHVFITSVLPGGAADKAGLLAGDEIISADHAPYRPIESLRDHVGKQIAFGVKRYPEGDIRTFDLVPVLVNPKTELLEAEKSSIRLIEAGESRIGYIHIYSYAGQEYHDVLVSAISWGALKDADALIIDLRYGVGGADPAYLNIFNPDIPVIIAKDNTGKAYRYDPQWRKPAVLLVNRTSRSGKELLAFGARRYEHVTVIGEQTAGAVVGARLFPLSNGDLLYLAVRSARIDGVKLEGVGVAPDINIPMDIRYCRGSDVQLDRAVEFLTQTPILNDPS